MLFSFLLFFQITSISYAAESTDTQSGSIAISSDDSKTPQTPPSSRFYSYCREKPWFSSFQPTIIEKLSGMDAGASFDPKTSLPKSTLDIVRVIPQNPRCICQKNRKSPIPSDGSFWTKLSRVFCWRMLVNRAGPHAAD